MHLMWRANWADKPELPLDKPVNINRIDGLPVQPSHQANSFLLAMYLRMMRSHYHPAACRSASRARRRRHPAGFTLLELLLVLAILVVIGGIVTVNIGGAKTEANINATKTQLNNIKGFITQYQIRMNGLPETLEELRDGPSDSAKQAKWVAPIISEIPSDAWENPINYTVTGNTYELRSGGADGQMSTDDDIVVEGS